MYFGPASWQARLLALAAAVVLRTSIAVLTLVGIVINRFFPAALQRARLDVIDAPMRCIRALPGTTVTRVRLSDCPAEWVVAPAARDSDRVIVYFHGSALVTLGLNSHRRFASKLSAATGAKVFNVGYRLAPLAASRRSQTVCAPTGMCSTPGSPPTAWCSPVIRRAG